MTRTISILFAFITLSMSSCAQDENFDGMFQRMTSGTVEVITPDSLPKDGMVYLLDARELEEFEISHIPGAQYIGYDDFSMDNVKHIPKDATVIVYCSVGYRSEKIGENLQEAGYGDVYNLYGGIFHWVNTGNEVENDEGEKTDKVHTYNKKWSKWLERGEKVYE
ncbi:rhodanese-like domain-containing protein [Sanyastnella coralliicola]|uniref:rhodanese-like domain-containing protein n=1 Tax=Sanyastnella coralliicola TaxID=3069118 RepID=UPI0027BA3CE3|nr:rhodanese-like domain-containing protein [Longitalea sp. SCSIO 12813]